MAKKADSDAMKLSQQRGEAYNKGRWKVQKGQVTDYMSGPAKLFSAEGISKARGKAYRKSKIKRIPAK